MQGRVPSTPDVSTLEMVAGRTMPMSSASNSVEIPTSAAKKNFARYLWDLDRRRGAGQDDGRSTD
jgi:hypothetical protein